MTPLYLLAMFGLGAGEIALIVVVAIIFIGPQKIPELAKSLGKGMREVRKAADEFKREMERVDDDIRTELNPPRPAGPLRPSSAHVGSAHPFLTSLTPLAHLRKY